MHFIARSHDTRRHELTKVTFLSCTIVYTQRVSIVLCHRYKTEKGRETERVFSFFFGSFFVDFRVPVGRLEFIPLHDTRPNVRLIHPQHFFSRALVSVYTKLALWLQRVSGRIPIGGDDSLFKKAARLYLMIQIVFDFIKSAKYSKGNK